MTAGHPAFLDHECVADLSSKEANLRLKQAYWLFRATCPTAGHVIKRENYRALYARRRPGCAAYRPGKHGPVPMPQEQTLAWQKRQQCQREAYDRKILRQSADWLWHANACHTNKAKCKYCKGWFEPAMMVGKQNACKACRAAKARQYRKNHPEKARAERKSREYRRRAQEKTGPPFRAKTWLKILKKARGRCQHCGTDGKMTVDHILPLSKGGTNHGWNLQPLCGPCNNRKLDVLTGAVQLPVSFAR